MDNEKGHTALHKAAAYKYFQLTEEDDQFCELLEGSERSADFWSQPGPLCFRETWREGLQGDIRIIACRAKSENFDHFYSNIRQLAEINGAEAELVDYLSAQVKLIPEC